ncbi:hypothetical protein [Streptomyces varsoviensis]|uniref:hypothetical protein n=1 Tax=Streptomyces varsoviensis TaxID=67373 RepID=UPI001FDED36A|nr:hypothetical protein [Streptomyces varsoviensis]
MSPDLLAHAVRCPARDNHTPAALVGLDLPEHRLDLPAFLVQRSPARLEQNAAALEFTLDAEALAALAPLSDQVMGERYTPAHTAEVARG